MPVLVMLAYLAFAATPAAIIELQPDQTQVSQNTSDGGSHHVIVNGVDTIVSN